MTEIIYLKGFIDYKGYIELVNPILQKTTKMPEIISASHVYSTI